jgi:hypothetical protein
VNGFFEHMNGRVDPMNVTSGEDVEAASSRFAPTAEYTAPHPSIPSMQLLEG